MIYFPNVFTKHNKLIKILDIVEPFNSCSVELSLCITNHVLEVHTSISHIREE